MRRSVTEIGNVQSVGFGLPPKYYDILLGKTVNQDTQAGTPLTWELLA
ncbi:SAF domain-containing protein [Nodularia spumigena]|nr:SAF domain-containing protein [Nodularia spumigena]MDB9317331.1 SAF domain-containing protein [Nodularia spumigena CS-590/01A]MDB9325891.1 SAF domain-containing protein [Nodularia spumigena CS-590/02]MDB9335117.1 SAF domain-containing protein [Nodularia spumigena CS-590/01]